MGMAPLLYCDRVIYYLDPIPVAFDGVILVPILAAALLIFPVLAFLLRKEVVGVDSGDVLRDPGGL